MADIKIPTLNSAAIGAATTSVGKVAVGVSNIPGTILQSASNIAGAGVGLSKSVVSGVQGLPIVGPSVLKPVISQVGKIADSTVGNIIPKNVDTSKAVEFANAPQDFAMEALTGPSQTVQEAVLRARIQNTVENKWDLVTLLFGNAPQSVVDQWRRGASISDIASSWVNKFGSPDASKGAFSDNGIANFMWVALTDPLNLLPLGKPFELAARAGKIAKGAAAGGFSASESLLAGKVALEDGLKKLISGGATEAAIQAQKDLITAADSQIKFFNKWEPYGHLWNATFGRIGDLKNAILSGPVYKQFLQSWSRVNATEGGSWILDRLSQTVGKDVVKSGIGDMVLTTANAAKSGMQQIATQVFRNKYDEAAQNIVRRLHELVGSGQTFESALDTIWSPIDNLTIRQYLDMAKVPSKEIKDLSALFSEGVPEYKVFAKRPEVIDTAQRIGSSIANSEVAKNPEFIVRTAAVQGEINLTAAGDAAVDVLTKDKNTLIRYAQSEELGVPFLTRSLQFGWDITEEKANEIARAAFSELKAGSRELLDVMDSARMKSFGKLLRLTAFARSTVPSTYGELAETIARRQAISESFFPNFPKEQQDALSVVLDSLARGRANNQGITVEEWFNRSLFGIKGISPIDDSVSITETLYNTVVKLEESFANATPEDTLRIANEAVPTQRMLEAAKASGVKELGIKSPVELIDVTTADGAPAKFALPGGLAGLEDTTKPFGLIDEAIIQSQPSMTFLDGATRVKIYKKIFASKGIDFNDSIAVTNRVIFGILSANTGLSPNAAMYTLLRVRNQEELSAFAKTWGELVKSRASEPLLGRRFKLQLPGAVEVREKGITTIKYPAGPNGELRGIEISDTNIGRVIKALVFANDNPSWFTLKAGETVEQLAERLTFLSGAGVKVGTFAVEVMNPAILSRGAIDKQMSAYIFDYALGLDKSGFSGLNTLVNDIISSGNTPKSITEYLNKMIPAVLDDGVKYTAPDGVEYIGNKTAIAKAAEKESTSVGVSAPHITGELRVKGWNKPVSESSAALHSELPAYVIPKTPNVGVYEGSVSEVMNNWIDKITADIAPKYPGIQDLSRAQKQWFLWDLKRGNIEPHSWINRGVDAMDKPTMEQLGQALTAIGKGGGTQQGAFRGTNPKIIAEFLQQRGEDVLGSTLINADQKAMIKIFANGDIQTAIHEIGHVARRQLDKVENAKVLEIYGVTDGVWSKQMEERFADDFTRYLYTGETPVRDLRDVFYKMRAWLSELWNGMKGTPLKDQLDPKMKEIFDNLFISNKEHAVAPTKDFYSRTTLISNRTLTESARADSIRAVEVLTGQTDGGKIVDATKYFDSIPDMLNRANVPVNEGATFNPVRGTFIEVGKDRGFSVTILPKPEFTGAERLKLLSDPQYLAEKVKEFVAGNGEFLRADGHYVGIYDNPEKGQFYIEGSKIFNTGEEAIAEGLKYKQESIFAINSGETLYLDTEKGIAAAALKNKPITKSASEISNLVNQEMSMTPGPDVLAELEKITKNVVDNFDAPAAEFFGKPHTWEEVYTFLSEHPEVAARAMNDVELQNLPAEFKDILDQLGGSDLYKFGVAPENGVLRRWAWASDRFGGRYRIQQAVPFADNLDHVAVSKLDELSAGKRLIPNSFDRLADKFRKYGPEVLKNNFMNRFIANITQKGISVNEAEKIMSKVSNLAYRKSTRIQGLWFEQAEIEDIYRTVIGKRRFEDYIVNNDPVKDIMDAVAGDMSVVGLTSGFTGRAKAWRPVIGALTDRLYPLFRFGKGNPVFANILEPIETKTMKFVDDIKSEYRRSYLAETDSNITRKMAIDNTTANLEINDGIIYNHEGVTNATASAALEAPGLPARVNNVVKKLYQDTKEAVLNPYKVKEAARNATAHQLAVREWVSAINKYAPEFIPLMAKHYGITDSSTLVERLIEDWLTTTNPIALEARMGAEARQVTGLYERTLINVGMEPSKATEVAAVAYGTWTESMRKATAIADKMQYFSPYRSWFERSINHPFLALYPYSYMTQKAIPAMLKIMFAPRIGGWVHPGMGYINYQRFREMVVKNAETNSDFLSEVIKSPELGYALNILVPAMPENLGFSLPGWLRRAVIRPALEGRGAQLSKIPEEVAKTTIGGTVAGQGASFAEAFASINKPLGQAAIDMRNVIAEGLQRNLSNK